MDVVICRDAGAAEDLTARHIAAEIETRPTSVLGLATGRTMEGVYARLLALDPPIAAVTTFNLDEYVGLGPGHPQGYRAYMQSHLFGPAGIAGMLPDGDAPDLEAESRSYEARIAAAGGIDLQLLGIGETGHIGFNEPHSGFESRTRAVHLSPRTRDQNATMFGGDPQAVPPRALTMGIGTILEARRILLLATGARKAAPVAEAVEGPLTEALPASALQRHGAATIVLDPDAADRIVRRDEIRAAAWTDPRWAAMRSLLDPA